MAVAAVDWLSGGVAVVGKRVGTAAVDSIRWAEVSKETSCWANDRFSTVQCTFYVHVQCRKNNNTTISEVRKCRFSCTLVGEDAA